MDHNHQTTTIGEPQPLMDYNHQTTTITEPPRTNKGTGEKREKRSEKKETLVRTKKIFFFVYNPAIVSCYQ